MERIQGRASKSKHFQEARRGRFVRAAGLCSLLIGVSAIVLNCGPATDAGSKQPGPENEEASPEPSENPSDKVPSAESSKNSASASPSDDNKESEENDPGDTPESDEDAPKFDLGALPDVKTPNPEDECECEPNTDLIYLLDHAGYRLWTYNPKDNSFKQIGDVNCPASADDAPFSLAVDRFANAWVQMSPSGKLFKVNTLKDNVCTDSGYTPGSAGPLQSGMAFSDRTDDKECEQLYLHSSEGGPDDWVEGSGVGKLGTIDPENVKGALVSSIDYNGGEMTGTRDGRLFAFAGKHKGTLIEYSPKDGSIVKKTELGDLVPTFAFAFAFWGGDFYFFTLATNQLPLYSKVTKLDYDGDGSLTTVVDKVPFMVVGAGVSVCAPIKPPQ